MPRKRVKVRKPQAKPFKAPWKATLALGALLLGSGAGINIASNSDWNKRYQSYVDAHNASELRRLPLAARPNYPFPQNVKYSWKLLQRENNFDAYVSSLLPFISKNEDAIDKLINTEYENAGYIMRDGNDFALVPVETNEQITRSYIREMLAGNFSNKKQFLEMARRMAKVFNPDNLPQISTERLANELEGCTGLTDKKCEALRTYFTSIDGFLKHTVTTYRLFDEEFVFAPFHTHTSETGPSPDDIGGTFYGGPWVVFSRENGKLNAYAVNRGKSTPIYPAK